MKTVALHAAKPQTSCSMWNIYWPKHIQTHQCKSWHRDTGHAHNNTWYEMTYTVTFDSTFFACIFHSTQGTWNTFAQIHNRWNMNCWRSCLSIKSAIGVKDLCLLNLLKFQGIVKQIHFERHFVSLHHDGFFASNSKGFLASNSIGFGIFRWFQHIPARSSIFFPRGNKSNKSIQQIQVILNGTPINLDLKDVWAVKFGEQTKCKHMKEFKTPSSTFWFGKNIPVLGTQCAMTPKSWNPIVNVHFSIIPTSRWSACALLILNLRHGMDRKHETLCTRNKPNMICFADHQIFCRVSLARIFGA